ncbi:coiled-coil domain-containing protein 124 [Cydia strobilella]|uniref:coiled-coil domain-containing protein 124 n=1 Tax=Cydia strobilella TaxID=1100964 RepID=UPI0030047533
MPKKFVGENSKAVAARQRKEDAKTEKDAKLKKMIEDAAWEDNDDKLKKKQQKKDEQEKKRLEQLQKKQEAKALLEKEMESIKSTPKVAPAPKITRAQIAKIQEKSVKPESPKPVPARVVVEEPPLEENLNSIQLDGEVAQSVDEAISLLSDKAEIDRHPEKRLKAAYTAFEEVTMPRLKEENPTLRLSQLKQLLRKEWLKSPQNPLNQKISA